MSRRIPGSSWFLLDRWLDAARPERTATRVLLVVVVGLMLAGVWLLVWATGGTRGPYLHAAYLPVLLAAVALGMRASVAAGAVATLLMGPLMPLDVASGAAQTAAGWLYRGAFFVLIGGFVAGACSVLSARSARNRALHEDLAETYSRNLRVFAGLVESRDEQTYGHCDRVGRNAVAIGRQMGLDRQVLGRLYWAGLLHDLGKIGVPESILRKPGPLTPEEFHEVKKHCHLGHTILLNVSQDFAPIAAGVLNHHERWDGGGYPNGLAGDAIPLFGRVVAVADVFEALTSHRPYRDPMTEEEAAQVIRDGRGLHFDPAVTDAFFAALERGEIGLEHEHPTVSKTFVDAIVRPDSVGMDLLNERAPWRTPVTS